MPADLQRRTGKLAFVASNLGPFALCGIDNTSGIREERGARLFTEEEIEPLPDTTQIRDGPAPTGHVLWRPGHNRRNAVN
ncbi:MAG: hypothetical protein WB048_07675, partial [Pseudolabrys sp.]